MIVRPFETWIQNTQLKRENYMRVFIAEKPELGRATTIAQMRWNVCHRKSK
jgi:hypothetical protein